jgi:hypothetical protein
MQVNVVAYDATGRRVTDLAKEDFDLSEDGRRQELAVFVPEKARPERSIRLHINSARLAQQHCVYAYDFAAASIEAAVRKISAAYVALQEAAPKMQGCFDRRHHRPFASRTVQSRMNRFFATRRVLDTLTAIEQIAGYLGSVPGRKSIIWVTSGFPPPMGYDPPRSPRPGVRGTTRGRAILVKQRLSRFGKA